MAAMSAEIVVACRREPALVGEPYRSCRAVQLVALPLRDVRAKRADKDDREPDEHGYKRATHVELRADQLAGIVGVTCKPAAVAAALAYAKLIARAFAGVVVIDGVLVYEATDAELALPALEVAWRAVDRRRVTVPPRPSRKRDADWSRV
jgi:hypothetical protein